MNSMPVMNKAFVDGKIYDVIDLKDLGTFQYYGSALAVNTGQFILPIRMSQVVTKPGLYFNGLFYTPVYPRDDMEALDYSTIHLAYFVSAETLKDVVAAKEQLEKDEFAHLVSSTNVFTPVIDPVNDKALILGLKMAVTEKQCDINRYSEKFGPDFNNDRRKFNGHDITAAKYSSISNNLDIRTTLIIEDMRPDVANPMGKRIILTWVGDGINDTDYEDFYRKSITGMPVLDGYTGEEIKSKNGDIVTANTVDDVDDDIIDVCYF